MESKKIGLLTLPLKDNYGGIIQIAALKKHLNNEGYEVYFLNKKYMVSKHIRLARRLLRWNPFYKIFDFKNHAKSHRYIKNLIDFQSNELKPSTKHLYTSKQLTKEIEKLELDTVIVGSDQVWRMLYVGENFKDYFLEFAMDKNIKKISYAASFGVDKWEDRSNIGEVKPLLEKFNAISVREDSGVILCKNTFGIQQDVTHVLDPTLLPDLAYYDKIIQQDNFERKEIGLFNYVLDKSTEKDKFIHSISNQLRLNIDTIYHDNSIESCKLKASMGEWLYHFKHANFIITDSFHGTIFSIIFNKQFITIGNRARGLTRFLSLLKVLDLTNRLIVVEDNNEESLSLVEETINYSEVNKRINKWRSKSVSFIKSSLN